MRFNLDTNTAEELAAWLPEYCLEPGRFPRYRPQPGPQDVGLHALAQTHRVASAPALPALRDTDDHQPRPSLHLSAQPQDGGPVRSPYRLRVGWGRTTSRSAACRKRWRQSIALTPRVLREANRHAHGLLPLARLVSKRGYARLVARSLDHAYRPLLGRKPPHSPAATLARAFPEAWANYAKICVVRNP
ncbi:MAG: hypothetical protein R3D78_09915 [Paracoccaceae bacterium]